MKTFSEMFYGYATLAPEVRLPLPDNHEDRGIYILSGSVISGAEEYPAGQMLVFRPGDQISVKAGGKGATLMLLGGATLESHRYISWNFVSHSKEKIEFAKEEWRRADWENGLFKLPPDDDREHIPLP